MADTKRWTPPYLGEEYEKGGYEAVIYEKDAPLGRVILNGPEKRNPLNQQRKTEIAKALREAELDEEVKVVIIKGAGPSFCAGYDITPTQPGEPPRGSPPHGYVHPDRDALMNAGYHTMARELYFPIWDMQKPVIAQVHGYCLAGGTHLASFCDLRIVAEDAQIGYPVSRNWTSGGYQYMPWMCGVTKAKFYMFTGKPMDGKEAFRCNWASAVFPAAKLEEETENIALDIAKVDTDLIMLTKRNINRQMEIMGMKTGLMYSIDTNALAGFRVSQKEGEGDEFRKIAREKGLKAALDWRDQSFHISYRTSEGAEKAREARTRS